MTLYRITRTTLRGPFENHACFVAAMVLAQATGDAFMVDTVPQPGNSGGPNDRSYTLWRQEKPISIPPTCNPELMTHAGKNGWGTEAEARAVLKAILAGEAAVQAKVEAANAAATSPANVAAGVAGDIGAAAGKAADAAAGAVAGASAGALALWAAEALAAGALAWWAARKWLGGRKR